MKKKTIYIHLILVLTFLSCGEKLDCKIPETVTYSGEISALVETKCFSCHAPDVYKKKASRMKIFNYESLKEAAESGLLMGALMHKKGFVAMPFRKGEKIDTCSMAKFQKWVDTGMK